MLQNKFSILGKALNVLSEYSAECEERLSKVVKRDPSRIEAWNMLGETFWKKGDVSAARDCFESALKRKKDKAYKASLRSLSMVLRQIKPQKVRDDQVNVLQSVEQCFSTFLVSWTTFRRDFVLGPTF